VDTIKKLKATRTKSRLSLKILNSIISLLLKALD
jgi:hypothetical protein